MICATHVQFIQALELKAEAVDGTMYLHSGMTKALTLTAEAFTL